MQISNNSVQLSKDDGRNKIESKGYVLKHEASLENKRVYNNENYFFYCYFVYFNFFEILVCAFIIDQ